MIHLAGFQRHAGIVIGVKGVRDAELAKVRHAFCASSTFFGFRQRGQKQRRQNGDDGNDDQEFDQCEGRLPPRERRSTDADLESSHSLSVFMVVS